MLHVVPKSGSGIGDDDFDHIVGNRNIGNGELAAQRLRHGLERIAKQIDQDLLNLDPIDQHLIV